MGCVQQTHVPFPGRVQHIHLTVIGVWEPGNSKNHLTNGLKGLFWPENYVIVISKSFACSKIAVPPPVGDAVSRSLSPKGCFSEAKTEHITSPQMHHGPLSPPPHPLEERGRSGLAISWVSAVRTKSGLSGLALCITLGPAAPWPRANKQSLPLLRLLETCP